MSPIASTSTRITPSPASTARTVLIPKVQGQTAKKLTFDLVDIDESEDAIGDVEQLHRVGADE